MKLGKDFFKMFGFAIQVFRLFASVFGDAEEKKEAEESKLRTASANPEELS